MSNKKPVVWIGVELGDNQYGNFQERMTRVTACIEKLYKEMGLNANCCGEDYDFQVDEKEFPYLANFAHDCIK